MIGYSRVTTRPMIAKGGTLSDLFWIGITSLGTTSTTFRIWMLFKRRTVTSVVAVFYFEPCSSVRLT